MEFGNPVWSLALQCIFPTRPFQSQSIEQMKIRAVAGADCREQVQLLHHSRRENCIADVVQSLTSARKAERWSMIFDATVRSNLVGANLAFSSCFANLRRSKGRVRRIVASKVFTSFHSISETQLLAFFILIEILDISSKVELVPGQRDNAGEKEYVSRRVCGICLRHGQETWKTFASAYSLR